MPPWNNFINVKGNLIAYEDEVSVLKSLNSRIIANLKTNQLRFLFGC